MKLKVLDIGSNSIRFLYSKVNDGKKIKVLRDELFKLRPTRKDYFERLEELYIYLQNLDSDFNFAVCTQFFRENKEFFEELKKIFVDFDVILLSKEEEAVLDMYAGKSVKENVDLVLDIGGGSFQIVDVKKKIFYSFPFGAVKMKDRFGENIEEIEKFLINELGNLNLIDRKILVGIGGAITAVASFILKKKITELNLVEFDFEKVKEFISIVRDMDLEKREEVFGKFRGDIVLSGSVILKSILKILRKKNFFVSNVGIVHGFTKKVVEEDVISRKKRSGL